MLQLDLGKILFLDIETVPQFSSFESLPEIMSELWEKKSSYFRKDNESAADVYARAGIYAEFGKIICISVGHFHKENSPEKKFRLKTFAGEDEKILLSDFISMLEGYSDKKEIQLCAHNGKEFDFPYLARRILINSLKLPSLLNFAGKKPWEVQHLDTMQLWKFGDYKHYTSLELLATVFGIPSPKDETDGSMIHSIFWQDKDLKRITEYCQRDVITVAQLILKFCGKDYLKEKEIEIVSS